MISITSRRAIGIHLDFFHKFDNLSGDEIRKIILDVDLADLDKIIQYLARLKEKGIFLGNVFNLNDYSEPADNENEAHLIGRNYGQVEKYQDVPRL